jgi:Protein of unknown function (DUF4232)
MVDSKESDQVDGGLGHHAMTIDVKNLSSSLCSLQGVPALTLLDKANHPLCVPVCPNCGGYLFPKQAVQEVLLPPNASAYLIVGFNINDGVGPCRNAKTLSLRLSGQRNKLKISVGGMRTCGPVDITAFLAAAGEQLESATDLCSALPRVGRRVRAGPISFGPRFGANYRTLPGLQTTDSIRSQ